jgi:hypothetical protein
MTVAGDTANRSAVFYIGVRVTMRCLWLVARGALLGAGFMLALCVVFVVSCVAFWIAVEIAVKALGWERWAISLIAAVGLAAGFGAVIGAVECRKMLRG